MSSEKSPTAGFNCRDLSDELVAADESLLSLPTRVHATECLRCQAELAGYRRLRRMMSSLKNAPIELDPTLEREIFALLDEIDDEATRHTPNVLAVAAATIGGIAAATAGVIALTKRQRRFARLAI